MLDRFSYNQKYKALLPAAGIGLLICWYCSFSRTVEAVQRNHQLQAAAADHSDISFNPAYSERKRKALSEILKSYRVSDAEWSNELWMKASSMAARQDIHIAYARAAAPAATDTITAGKKETLYGYGGYLQLVRLLDTLEKTPHIGRISGLQIRIPKEDGSGVKRASCMMRVDFRGIINSETNKQ